VYLRPGRTYTFDTTSYFGQEVQHLFRVHDDGTYEHVAYGGPMAGTQRFPGSGFTLEEYVYTSRLVHRVSTSPDSIDVGPGAGRPGLGPPRFDPPRIDPPGRIPVEPGPIRPGRPNPPPRPEFPLGEPYVLMVRGDTSLSSTVVTLRMNFNKVLAIKAPAGGEVVSGGGLVLGGNEDDDVHVVPTPGGSTAPFAMAIRSDARWTHVYPVRMHGGVAGASFVPYRSDATHFLFGTPIMAFHDRMPPQQPRSGVANVYVNDHIDSDGDGLGDELEQELGLCWSEGPGCPRDRTDPRDTDRDGIPDGEELLGMRGDNVDWSLPRWGADPMQQDAFVYVAWRTRTGRDMNPYAGPFVEDDTEHERHPANWTEAIATFFREGPAAHLGNPNGEDGLRIHFNIGIPPNVAANEHLYGVWSDGETHTLPPRHTIEITDVPEGVIDLEVDGRRALRIDPSEPVNCNVHCIAGTIAAMIELHGFSVVHEHDFAAGTVSIHVDAATPGVDFEINIRTIPPAPAGVIRHSYESNVGARNRADDPDYLPVDFRGRVRYLVITGNSGAGQANHGRVFSSAGIRTVTHELGHAFGIRHWGHDAWLHVERSPSSLDILDHSSESGHVFAGHADINCAPHYLSIMNYAYSHTNGYGFSSQDRYISVNPASVSETGTWPGIVTESFDVAISSPEFRFMTTGAGVDWDMSGSITDGRTRRVRAPLRLLSGGGSCKTFGIARQQVSESEPYGDGTITQVGEYLVAFYIPEGDSNPENRVHFRMAEIGPPSLHGCAWSDNPLDYVSPLYGPYTGCHAWSEERQLVSAHTNVRYVAAFGNGYPGAGVYVASQLDDGTLHVERFSLWGGDLIWPPSSQFITDSARGRPDISVIYASSEANAGWNERLVLMYNREIQVEELTSGVYHGSYLDDTGNFVPFPALTHQASTSGGGYFALAGPGGVSLAAWPHPEHHIDEIHQDERVTCAVFAGENDAVHPYCFDPVRLVWIDMADHVWKHLSDDPEGCEDWQTFERFAGENGRCLPMTRTPPNLEFRYTRTDEGLIYDSWRGNYGLTYHRTTERNRARIWISTYVERDAHAHPLSGGWSFDHWNTYFYNQWFDQEWDHISVQQYDSPTTGSAVALTARQSRDNSSERGVFVYPFASGTFNTPIGVGSDFRIMREYVCSRMANRDDVPIRCAPPYVF